MATASLSDLAAKQSQAFSDLESPIMDAFMTADCAQSIIEREMNSIFSQTKPGDDKVLKMYFSRDQAERCLYMINQVSDRLTELKKQYYGAANAAS